MNIKKIAFLVVVAAAVGIGLWLTQRSTKAQNQKNPFTTEKPIERKLVQFVNASGTLKAKNQISVGSLVAGRVIEIRADDNDVVKKDQILAILDNGIGDTAVMKLKALLEEAQANLEFQEKFYARQQDLHASGQLSQNQFDEFTQNYKVTKARVDQTKYALELEEKTFNNLFIKSPDKGIVIAKKIDMGQMITSVLQATVLYEIAPNLNDMEGYIDVDEADIGMVKENQSVVFSVDAFPKTKFKAKVDRIQYLAKIIDNVVTYATIIRVKNPTLSLRPGMTINVDIKVAKSKKGLSIPNKALRLSSMTITEQAKTMNIACDVADKSQNKKSAKGDQEISKHVKTMQDFIWVMDAGKIKQTKVKLGVNDGKFTEVLEGITASTEVITEVEEIPKENVVLQAIFAKPGGIGK